jgi:hypothetical protein
MWSGQGVAKYGWSLEGRRRGESTGEWLEGSPAERPGSSTGVVMERQREIDLESCEMGSTAGDGRWGGGTRCERGAAALGGGRRAAVGGGRRAALGGGRRAALAGGRRVAVSARKKNGDG